MTKPEKAVRNVLLDIDGTLVDSNDAHAHAWEEALAQSGFNIPFDRIRPLIGMGGDKLLRKVSGPDPDTREGKQVQELRQKIFLSRYLPHLEGCPGAKELLRHFHERGLKMGVASSAKDEELNPLLKICGADKLIETKSSSDDVSNSKPDPDIVQAALKKASFEANETLMLGDTPYDIVAAAGAAVSVIAFRTGGWGDQELAGAIAIYDSPLELLSRFDSSPFAAGK